jgi:hypothetical protein
MFSYGATYQRLFIPHLQWVIVVGTGWYWWGQHGKTAQSYVYAFDTSLVFGGLLYADPAKLPYLSGWPQLTDYPGFSSPALADLDGDGDLEVIIGTGDPYLVNDAIPGAGSVYAWHHNGQSVTGWPIHPKNPGNNDTAVRSSPVIADMDNDGNLEVLFSMIWDVQVYNANGTFQEMFQTRYTIWASPAVGDTNGDGKMEVWIGGGDALETSQGYLWRFESTTSGIGAQPWPMFHRDAQHTGYYPLPSRLSVQPTSFYIYHGYGTGNIESRSLQIRNSGDLPVAWSIASQPPSVSVSPSSGTVSTQVARTVTVTVDTGTYTTGTYSLGSIVITGTMTGGPIAVPVTLYVDNVYRLYLPLVTKSGGGTAQADLIYWTTKSFRLDGGQIIESSPTLGDLDGDGQGEVIVGTTAQRCTQGSNCNSGGATRLVALRSNGSLFWKKDTLGPVRSSPAVGNISGDSKLEVVVTVGGDVADTAH